MDFGKMEFLEKGAVRDQGTSKKRPQLVHILVVGELHIAWYLVQKLGSVGKDSIPQGFPLLLPLDLNVGQE